LEALPKALGPPASTGVAKSSTPAPAATVAVMMAAFVVLPFMAFS